MSRPGCAAGAPNRFPFIYTDSEYERMETGMSYNFFVQSNIHFGIGAAEVLPELVQKYGFRKIMVVYDGGVKAAGISEKVLAQIGKTQAGYVVFDGVIPNPTNAVVEQAAELAKREQVDGYQEDQACRIRYSHS